ncbi:MAG: GNAT family N-acetyltransferase [Anaerolineaceae bacterium]|nr:GNAT family N-acetyltransferase [Anaerolineaceae bacterium]
MVDTIEIRPFHPRHQDEVKKLILAGLADHWGTLDLSLNPDLNDIAHSYAGETFLLAFQGDKIVGCGALVTEDMGAGYGRIVRMSVNKTNRRQGIGQRILWELEETAVKRQFRKLVLETTETWQEVVAFYQANGYRIVKHRDGDTHFEKEL